MPKYLTVFTMATLGVAVIILATPDPKLTAKLTACQDDLTHVRDAWLNETVDNNECYEAWDVDLFELERCRDAVDTHHEFCLCRWHPMRLTDSPQYSIDGRYE